jgi:hypothetical protein
MKEKKSATDLKAILEAQSGFSINIIAQGAPGDWNAAPAGSSASSVSMKSFEDARDHYRSIYSLVPESAA